MYVEYTYCEYARCVSLGERCHSKQFRWKPFSLVFVWYRPRKTRPVATLQMFLRIVA